MFQDQRIWIDRICKWCIKNTSQSRQVVSLVTVPRTTFLVVTVWLTIFFSPMLVLIWFRKLKLFHMYKHTVVYNAPHIILLWRCHFDNTKSYVSADSLRGWSFRSMWGWLWIEELQTGHYKHNRRSSTASHNSLSSWKPKRPHWNTFQKDRECPNVTFISDSFQLCLACITSVVALQVARM